MSNENDKATQPIKMDDETAAKDFSRLCDSWKLTLEDEKENVKRLIKAIKSGRFVIEEQGPGLKLQVRHNLIEAVSTDGKKTHLIYKMIHAGDMMALDEYSDESTNSRLAALCRCMSRENMGFIRRMHPRDMFLGGTLGGLFLGT